MNRVRAILAGRDPGPALRNLAFRIGAGAPHLDDPEVAAALRALDRPRELHHALWSLLVAGTRFRRPDVCARAERVVSGRGLLRPLAVRYLLPRSRSEFVPERARREWLVDRDPAVRAETATWLLCRRSMPVTAARTLVETLGSPRLPAETSDAVVFALCAHPVEAVRRELRARARASVPGSIFARASRAVEAAARLRRATRRPRTAA
jgi:hypothetical protein